MTQIHLKQLEAEDVDGLLSGEVCRFDDYPFRFVRLLQGSVPSERLYGVGPLYEPTSKRWTLGLYSVPGGNEYGVDALGWPESDEPKVKLAEIQVELVR